MQQVTCDNCTVARDLDFCRDEDLIPDAPIQDASSRPWQCSFCQAEYNRLDIEERLISEVNGMVLEWATQDLKCVKCKTVRVNDFMEHCACSGEWGGSIKREEILKRLEVFRNVAKYYGLRMLGTVIGEVLVGL